jgi:hypothetical protein
MIGNNYNFNWRWGNRHSGPVILKTQSVKKITEMPVKDQIQELIDTIYWMSGSADFGYEGQAYEGWSRVRERIYELSAQLKGEPEEMKSFKELEGCDFDYQMKNSKEFHAIKNAIELWHESGSGINSPEADGIVNTIFRLCCEVRECTEEFFTNIQSDSKSPGTQQDNLEPDHPYHPENVSWNYSIPVQTGIQQWSVFVKKYKGMKDCVGIVEHKFNNFDSAEEFSTNNWPLGDYF